MRDALLLRADKGGEPAAFQMVATAYEALCGKKGATLCVIQPIPNTFCNIVAWTSRTSLTLTLTLTSTPARHPWRTTLTLTLTLVL